MNRILVSAGEASRKAEESRWSWSPRIKTVRTARNVPVGQLQQVDTGIAGRHDGVELPFPRLRSEVAPGAVHIPDWLDLAMQQRIVEQWEDWRRVDGANTRITMPTGGVMSVETLCLGWQWVPYRYQRINTAGHDVLGFPSWLRSLGHEAVRDAYGDPDVVARYKPDVALMNFYAQGAKMGMHRDADENSPDPIVSLSIGDTCTFRFGNTHSKTRPYTDVELRSGDLFVFGGPSRLAYHGVVRMHPGTAHPESGLESGRLNITVRVTGLSPGGPEARDPEPRLGAEIGSGVSTVRTVGT
jgi:DNA oxidative demethylase